MTTTGGLSPIQENVRAGTTERLVFSDLVRTSLSRQEDASLLRVILAGKDGLRSQEKRTKAIREVEVRECWRVAREKEILARANEFGLVSVENPEDRRNLADQIASFTRLSRFQATDFEYNNKASSQRDLWLGGGQDARRTATRRSPSPYGGVSGSQNGRVRPSSARPSSSGRTSRSMTASAYGVAQGKTTAERRKGLLSNGTNARSGQLTSSSSSSKASTGRHALPRKEEQPRRTRVRPSSAPVMRKKTQTETKLLDITKTLLKGLENHKSADGTTDALKALEKNVSEAQTQLSDLVAAAGKKLQAPPSTPVAPMTSSSVTATSPSDRFRMHLTKLGYFGSTKADLVIAEHQRQRHAILVIQRAARKLLQRKALEKKKQEEVEERKRRALEFRHDCARVIQAWYRSKMEERAQRAGTLERCKKGLAARAIQKHYRYHRLIKVFRAEAPDHISGAGAPAGGRGAIPSAWRAANIIQKCFRMHRVQRRLRAARSEASEFLQWRRAMKASWSDHKRQTLETLGAQSYLVFLFFSSGRETEKVMAHVREEEKMFSTSWLKYERKVKRKALHKPLPRNWVPHNDAVTGKIYFINTRTNEAYTTHPNLREIAPDLAAQRERASIAKYTRISVLLKYIEAIDGRASKLQSHVLQQMVSNKGQQ
ncbi:hypothetical protein A3770_11p63750 [Chloropicon primus]|uniref:WW domain-containing protein n=3 Tax=Chloropicon primus TaxID=1764295 RepID=A0A5B8MU20_9CHLO|nr:hypothetical protein A3770_11p63750 [Chloropicon primus]|eukprot:QDZ23857.1 hypothetical protein A3770_11p63750 [Chloropicon primus]